MNIIRLTKVSAGAFFLVIQVLLSGHAQQSAPPAGRILLTISGEIDAGFASDDAAATDQEHSASVEFDLERLESLGVIAINTETPWTNGVMEFEGVLVRDILDFVKADGEFVKAIALDDYVVDIPIQDFLEHDVIVATRIKGKPMKVRENGPLWIIYPWDDNPDLRRPHFYSNSIWQLKSLMVLP